MYPPKEWINKSNNKVNQILEEASESISFSWPVPIFKIVKQYAPDTVIFATVDKDINKTVSACAIRDRLNGWTILVNGNEPKRRQRFSVAHELGHMVLLSNTGSTAFSGKSNGWEEKLCDYFAGKLLVPDNLLIRFFEYNPSAYLEDVVTAFQVSPQVAYIRIRDLKFPCKTVFEYPFIR